MPAQQNDTPDAGPRRSEAPRLGPYETAYDICRGYDGEGSPRGGSGRRALPDPVWIGRDRDR